MERKGKSMRFNRNKLLALFIILLIVIGSVVWYFAFFSIKEEASTKDPTSSISKQQPEKKVVKNDNKFAALKGDNFDEAYIADMLAHHEGAVSMAEQAQAVTAHKEIRTLAGDITMTQSQEMMQMYQWQKEWGYKATSSGGHMSHGGAGAAMAGDMVEMINKLKDLTGEAYDKEFLEQMILHHEQAVEMSQYAKANAKHQEIKDLAKEVITAQTKEISEMKQWQMDWGY